MFEACIAYESGILDRQGFEPCDKPVWLLGRKYDISSSVDELNADVRAKLWFTYRRNFTAIGQTGMTSDRGWGCMLRCGQMVLAQALFNHHLGRDCWRQYSDDAELFALYKKILKLFQDKKTSTYSIHQMAQMGVSEGKEIGQWFGPNTVAQVLKKLTAFDDWSSLRIHVALDNTVVMEEIDSLCKTDGDEWNPLLLIIPLRLGLLVINPIYIDGLKMCLQLPHSVGMIGGKPSQALYFIGYTGDEVVFLDPHITQNAIDLDELSDETFDDSTYHASTCSRISFLNMDPSLALCFVCSTQNEWHRLANELQRIVHADRKQSLFEVITQRQSEWSPGSVEPMERAVSLDSGESEEEFEILG